MCRWSANSRQPTATATDRLLLTPPLSTVGWSKTGHFKNPGKKTGPSPLLKIVSSQAIIRNKLFDQRYPRHPEVSVLRRHRHTDIQTDIATLRLNRPSGLIQWKCEYRTNRWITGFVFFRRFRWFNGLYATKRNYETWKIHKAYFDKIVNVCLFAIFHNYLQL